MFRYFVVRWFIYFVSKNNSNLIRYRTARIDFELQFIICSLINYPVHLHICAHFKVPHPQHRIDRVYIHEGEIEHNLLLIFDCLLFFVNFPPDSYLFSKLML